MKTNYHLNEKGLNVMLVMVMLVFSFTYNSYGQRVETEEKSGDFCKLNHLSKSKWSINVNVTQMPRRVTGEEISHIPLLEGLYNLNLTENLNGNIMFSSCVLTNLVGFNLSYSFNYENFNVGAGLTGKVWLGSVSMSGFDVSGNGAHVSPLVFAELKLGDYSIIGKGELDLALRQSFKFGNEKVNESTPNIYGASFSVMVLQPFFGDFKLSFSATVAYSRPGYLTWINYSSDDRKFLLPSFGVGLTF
jgi:hypothetical protein